MKWRVEEYGLWSEHGEREAAASSRCVENGIYSIGRKCMFSNTCKKYFYVVFSIETYTKLYQRYNFHSSNENTIDSQGYDLIQHTLNLNEKVILFLTIPHITPK